MRCGAPYPVRHTCAIHVHGGDLCLTRCSGAVAAEEVEAVGVVRVVAGVVAAAVPSRALGQGATVSARIAATRRRMWSASGALTWFAHSVEQKWSGSEPMKVLVTAVAPALDAVVDPRFGRGAYFVVVDTETMMWHAEANSGINASGGAGIQAAQFVVNQKPDAVISGDFGPNAYNALNAAGVPMYLCGTVGTVREMVERFKSGQLQRVGSPTQAGHHGRG